MSDSKDSKHVPLVFDADLDGPVTNNAERNRRIEEEEAAEHSRKKPRALQRQEPSIPTNHSQTSQQMTDDWREYI